MWWQELIDGYASNADARLGMDQCTVGFAGETTFGIWRRALVQDSC